MQKQEILKNYPMQEDKLFIAKVLDKINERDCRNKIATTDFLNLHERSICEKLLNVQKINNYIFYGGTEETERTMLILYPDKLEKEYIMKQLENWITVIRITLPKYNNSYTHREYLGGIMKLGVKREKIGDIIVLEDGADIIIKKDIVDFLLQELENLTRFQKSKIEEKSIYNVRKTMAKNEERIIIVPSYRLDVIIGETFKISRSKVNDIIDEERAFINSMLCRNGAKFLKLGDKITVRGKGRFEILEETGNTKKENIRIKILLYK